MLINRPSRKWNKVFLNSSITLAVIGRLVTT